MLHPKQYEVNEAWIAFRLNNAPVRTDRDGDFNCIALMDAPSRFILGSEFVPATVAEPTRTQVRRLFKDARRHKQQLPKTLLVPREDVADQLTLEATQQSIDVVRVPARELLIFIGEARGKERSNMIRGMRAMFHSSEAQALRTFLREKLLLTTADAGGGWLIVDAPGADLGVHPPENGEPPSGTAEVSFYCDRMEETVEELKRTWTITGVCDVPGSCHWYQSLFGQPATSTDHSDFGQILDSDGTVLLCRHEWGVHEHPSLNCRPACSAVTSANPVRRH